VVSSDCNPVVSVVLGIHAAEVRSGDTSSDITTEIVRRGSSITMSSRLRDSSKEKIYEDCGRARFAEICASTRKSGVQPG
jgi:hypothetical protein